MKDCVPEAGRAVAGALLDISPPLVDNPVDCWPRPDPTPRLCPRPPIPLLLWLNPSPNPPPRELVPGMDN